MKTRHLLFAAAAAFLSAPTFAADTYTIDKNHSEVSFQIRHLVSRVRGVFRDFDATIVHDEAKPEASSVEFRIRATSIDTGHERRDNHLRSADFFDVENHPEIVFRSTQVEKSRVVSAISTPSPSASLRWARSAPTAPSRASSTPRNGPRSRMPVARGFW